MDLTDNYDIEGDDTADPTVTDALGVPQRAADAPFNWAGLGDFIQEVSPLAIGITSAVLDKDINISGSSTAGGAVSLSAGDRPVNAVAGLGASPLGSTSLSTGTLLLLAAAVGVVLYAVSRA